MNGVVSRLDVLGLHQDVSALRPASAPSLALSWTLRRLLDTNDLLRIRQFVCRMGYAEEAMPNVWSSYHTVHKIK